MTMIVIMTWREGGDYKSSNNYDITAADAYDNCNEN